MEIATTIKDNENKKMISILLSDKEDNLKQTYSKIKEITFNIFKELKNIEPIFEFATSEDYYHQDLTQNIIVNNNIIGQIKVFSKKVTNKISKKNCFVVLEIDFNEYLNVELQKNIFKEISKYPTTELDYTILTNRGEYYNKLEEILINFKSPIIIDYKLIDIYLEETVKKVTIKYTVGSMDKTLTSEELQNFKEEFIKFLKEYNLSIIEE